MSPTEVEIVGDLEELKQIARDNNAEIQELRTALDNQTQTIALCVMAGAVLILCFVSNQP